LSHVAALGDEVSGIVCAECGEQNDPTALTCRACQKPLRHSCPKCAAPVNADASWCASCGLPRSGFFGECVRQDTAARTAAAHRNRRFSLIDDIVLIAVLAILIGLAWWQQLRRDAWEWKVWLAITVWYVVMWAFSKSK
jgi:ribosomal protein L40E